MAPREGHLVAVVPVRAGSLRCAFKNSRPFAFSTLLQRKLETLRQVEGIDEIVVSSDDPGMLALAERCGVKTHVRPEKFAASNAQITGSDFFEHLALSACEGADYVMYCVCVSPFVSKETFEKAVRMYRLNEGTFDSVATVASEKEFVYFGDVPLNFDPSAAVNSQDLQPVKRLTFGACILSRDLMIQRRHCVGEKPYLYEVSQIEGIDIDTSFDFVASEALLRHAACNGELLSEADADALACAPRKPLLLDCTLRDGGYVNNWNFGMKFAVDAYRAASAVGCDYFETGFRSDEVLFPPKSEFGGWAYVKDDVGKYLKTEVPNGCDLAVMAKFDSFSADDFGPASSSPFKLVRVLFSLYDENKKSLFSKTLFEKCLEECRALKDKGYTVALNLACCEQLTPDVYEYICDTMVHVKARVDETGTVVSAKCCADILYLADTYGALSPEKASEIVRKVRYEFVCVQKYVDMQVGFHAHNNLGDGVAKTMAAIDAGATVVDSTISGLGRGAGNLSTEHLLVALHRKFGTSKYEVLAHLEALMLFRDEHILPFSTFPVNSRLRYGPAPLFEYTAVSGIHPNYADYLMQHHAGLPIRKCIEVLKIVRQTVLSNSTNNFSIETLKLALNKADYMMPSSAASQRVNRDAHVIA
tara:strand:- start:2637 stop:4571 length:1935 start_codon:yes stop_codon:yes gene_type:complete